MISCRCSCMEEHCSSTSAINSPSLLPSFTEVFLWDDASFRTERGSCRPQILKFVYDEDEDENGCSSLESVKSNYSAPEDLELSRQLSHLGLPVSFDTNKEKRSRQKSSRSIHSFGHDTKGCHPELLYHETTQAFSNSECSSLEEVDEFLNVVPVGAGVNVNAKTSEPQGKKNMEDNAHEDDFKCGNQEESTLTCEDRGNETCISTISSRVLDQDVAEACNENSEIGVWRAYWDSYYHRYYYYNSETKESTWSLEGSIEMSSSTPGTVIEVDLLESNKSTTAFTENIIYQDDTTSPTPPNIASENEVLDHQKEPGMKKRKNKAKSKKLQRKLSKEDSDIYLLEHQGEWSAYILKYWCQRYFLFSKFDDGIKLDEEGWFSVTPELIAHHHAKRCGNGVIIDCCTGVGGNAIQFAGRNRHVVAIDINPRKIEYAQHNAAVYGVSDRIEFITGDFFLLAPKLKADAVFLSPPWGGPEYTKQGTYKLSMLRPHDGHFMFESVKKIAPIIIFFLPKSVDLDELAELARSSDPPFVLEVEKNFLNGKLKAVTAYFTKM